MRGYRSRLLTGICVAAVTTAGLSSAALAAAGDIYGGGAAVPAPDFRVKADCYALPTALIIKGTPPTFRTLPPFNYVNGAKSQDCSTTHILNDRTAYYISATSGTGILAQYSHDPKKYGFVDQAQTQYFPTIHFALSETPLSATDVGIWDNGGTETQGSSSVVVVAPGGTPLAGQYVNPLEHYGQVTQFPVSVDPLVISYDSTYKKVLNNDNSITSYHFHIKFTRTDGSGGLHLDPTTYCKIFNGQITNWNDPALKKLNGNLSLEDPADPTPAAQWSVPLQIVGRGDSAGATLIFTRHLAAVCPSRITGNQYADGASTLPNSLLGPTYNVSNPNYPPVAGETPGKFTLVAGMPGTAQYAAFTATPGGSNPNTIILGRVTYLSPDYALPGVLVSGDNTYNLNTATLQNQAGKWIVPSAFAAGSSFGSLAPPQSDSKGHYDASNTANGLRVNPQDWVQPSSKTSVLANPAGIQSYPIVGTANWIGYTCYASSKQVQTILGILKYGNAALINTDRTKGILSSIGIAPMPGPWLTAMEETFVTNVSGVGININTKGKAGPCAASGITGG